MLKTKLMAQHVQNTSEGVSLAKHSQLQSFLKSWTLLLRQINERIDSLKYSSSRSNEKQNIPRPMEMPDLLAGRYIEDVSRHSPQTEKAENWKPPDNSAEVSATADPALPEQRARLFAQLGIRDAETTHASIEDIEKLIASLSHIEVERRIEAAHTLADMYEKLSPEKQMHARINLILMTWRDADTYARIAAIKALGKTKMPDVVEALQVALRDEERDVRAAAARALGKIQGKTPAIALIAAAIRKNEHWSVRAATIRAMGESREHVFLNTINFALDDEDDSVRIAAIHALAQLEGLQAAGRLVLIAQHDKKAHVKQAAIIELGNLSEGV